MRRILGFVEDDKGMIKRAPTHKRKRCYFDRALVDPVLSPFGIDHVVERIVKRAQIRIDLLGHVAGQKSQSLASLDRRAHQHNPFHALAQQSIDSHGHRQIRLASPRRANAKRYVVLAYRFDIRLLTRRLRANRSLVVREQYATATRRFSALQRLQHLGKLRNCHVAILFRRLIKRHKRLLSDVYRRGIPH